MRSRVELRPPPGELVVEGIVEALGGEQLPAAGGARPGGFADDYDVADAEAAVTGEPVLVCPWLVGVGNVELLEDEFEQTLDVLRVDSSEMRAKG